MSSPEPAPTYYDFPAIKKPEWKWPVHAYYFVGGVAGGAYLAAALADMCGRPEDRSIVCAGRYLQFGALLLCPPLLIADLGRPERFHHMLRVFRPRSMMNQGSWGLTIFGLFSSAAVLAQLLEDLAPGFAAARSEGRRQKAEGSPDKGTAGRSAGAFSGLPSAFCLLPSGLRALTWLGIPPAAYVASYTGVLLSATNVPLWAGNRYGLGPLFFASALSAGIAGTRLTANMLGTVSEETEARLDRAESLILATELAITAASAVELGPLAKPLKSGRVGRTYQIGALLFGIVAPLVLQKLGKKRPLLRCLRSALILLGSAITKATITAAGKQSADDPQAYFEYTKR